MTKSRILFGTNWKMNKTIAEAVDYVEKLLALLDSSQSLESAQVFLNPPFTAVAAVKQACNGRLMVGAQNMHWSDSGPFTGEISPIMLRELGVDLVQLGHAERRRYFNENDIAVNLKVRAALKHDIRPLICVGEGIEDKKYGVERETVSRQLRIALSGIPSEHIGKIIIAYEPVWAIGDEGKAAEPHHVRRISLWIHGILHEMFGEAAARISILYGGDVNASNALELLSNGNVDGLFVGRAAWKPENFSNLIRKCVQAVRRTQF